MNIRPATLDDLPALLEGGRAFALAAGLPEVDDGSLSESLIGLMESGVLLVADNGKLVGALGAVIYPHYWNADILIAQELFWWVNPEARGSSAGIRLLNTAEMVCRELGASRLIMLCLANLDGDAVANLYARQGYEPLEHTFSKVL